MMRSADVFVGTVKAAVLHEHDDGKFVVRYVESYRGDPISLTMPVATSQHEFEGFPPFFDGLLPEGIQLDALLKKKKLDAKDYFGQLIAVGEDLVGNVSVKEQV